MTLKKNRRLGFALDPNRDSYCPMPALFEREAPIRSVQEKEDASKEVRGKGPPAD